MDTLPIELIGLIIGYTDGGPHLALVCRSWRRLVKVGSASKHTCRLAADGHLSLLQWYVASGCRPDHDAFYDAAAHGHAHVLLWLLGAAERRGAGDMDRTHFPGDMMESAARNGHLDVVEAIHAYFVHGGRTYGRGTNLCAVAARYGHPDIVRWGLANGHSCNAYTMGQVGKGGSVEIARFLADAGIGVDYRLFVNAAYKGHVDLVRWCVANDMPRSAYAFAKAAGAGHLEVLRYLWACNPADPQATPMCVATEWVEEVAARGGHIAVLDWLHDKIADRRHWRAIVCAAEEGQRDAVAWLLDHGFPRHDGCIRQAAQRNQKAMVEWLIAHGFPVPLRLDVDRFQRGPKRDLMHLLESHGTVVDASCFEALKRREAFRREAIEHGMTGWLSDDDDGS